MKLATLIRFAVTAVVVVVAAFVGHALWKHYMYSPWTRDGRVRAEIVRVAPDVAGLVTDVRVVDNQTVKTAQIEVVKEPDLTLPPTPVAPNASITFAPLLKTKATTATYKFISDQAGSKFECKLDKAGWTDCKSPLKLKKLKPGKHTFKVRATKGDMIDQSPATRSWTVQKKKKKR